MTRVVKTAFLFLRAVLIGTPVRMWTWAKTLTTWLWNWGRSLVFYGLWLAIAALTVALMLGTGGVAIAPPHITVFGYVFMLEKFQIGVVQDNGLAIFLIEICCFTIHAHAWKITTVIDVMDKFSNPLRKLFVSKEQKRDD